MGVGLLFGELDSVFVFVLLFCCLFVVFVFWLGFFQAFLFLFGEFDPGSGRTLAACLTHASRTGSI